jgi:mono/diheme cytochrome c family protein
MRQLVSVGEDWRVTLRFRLALAAGLLALAGCSDNMKMTYSTNPLLDTLQQEQVGTDGKPVLDSEKKPVMQPKIQLKRRVVDSIAEVFGPDPQHMIVPKGSGLPEGGAWLASYATVAGREKDGERPVGYPEIGIDLKPTGRSEVVEGGFALYRKHCLHCHGVSGDGNGPTSAFLWPRPRDYRKGVYKFTSTTGQKPTRDDLKRIVLNGVGNSSMPSFEALMTKGEIQQVIDYVIFLSVRGETERRLILEASTEDEPKDEKAASEINKAKAEELALGVFDAWKNAETEVLNPPIPRTTSTPESIIRGKTLFLGLGTPKLECAGCHGPKGLGNGPSFVPGEMFREVVFGGDPALQDERLTKYLEADSERALEDAEPELAKIASPGEREDRAKKIKEARISSVKLLWTGGSLDDWGNPLRPANINNGTSTMYKGGRRPLDIYWRIAKGINGAKMPAHAQLLKPEQIWDLVNFVLALPYQPRLLDDAPETVPPVSTPPASTTASK